MSDAQDRITAHIESRLEYYRRMHEASLRLTDTQREALATWESEHVDGTGRSATSDWPGWVDLIGPPPWKYEGN